jgi:site-specific recombinase XerD
VFDGKETRRSMRTKDWTKAARQLLEWEAQERVIERNAPVTLAQAWESLIADLGTRVSPETVRKYKLLQRQMTAYASGKGLIHLRDFTLEVLGNFRTTWKDGQRTAAKKIERLRAFFRFAHDRNWVESNPATKLKMPKTSICPTLPLEPDEWLKLLAACDQFIAQAPAEGKLNAVRLKTLLILMRYSGMRVSDAVTLTTDQLNGNRLFRYTQKTGQPVYLPLPGAVIQALEATPRVTETRYFWSGQGKRQTVVCDWQDKIKKVFDLAGIAKGESNAVSHRLRDTFAVELLKAGTLIERVSVLLGHSSVRITEKHYNPWVRSRQEQLENDVRSAWKNDPSLENCCTNPVQIGKERVN